MPAAVDITGKKFGMLVAIRRVGSKSGRALWECKCDCGNTAYRLAKSLNYGEVVSCGCKHLKILRTNAITHNKWGERLYWVWHSMMQRVDNPNRREYRWYGRRGITVCDEWRDYEKFREWAYANGYDENAPRGECTIDRINYDGNYEPSNCRWVGMDVQRKNRRPRSCWRLP